MTRVILMAVLLTGCVPFTPEQEKVIEQDISVIEKDFIEAQLDAIDTTPKNH